MKHGEVEKANRDIFNNLVTLYYQGVDFEYGAPDIYEPFCEKVAHYLDHVNFWHLWETEPELGKLLFEQYKAKNYEPHYVELMYLPRIGIIEWFEEICGKYVK